MTNVGIKGGRTTPRVLAALSLLAEPAPPVQDQDSFSRWQVELWKISRE
jgi:hypothetical protein